MTWTVRQLNELQRAFVAKYAGNNDVIGVQIVGGCNAPAVLVTLPDGADENTLTFPETFEGIPVSVRHAQPMVLAYA